MAGLPRFDVVFAGDVPAVAAAVCLAGHRLRACVLPRFGRDGFRLRRRPRHPLEQLGAELGVPVRHAPDVPRWPDLGVEGRGRGLAGPEPRALGQRRRGLLLVAGWPRRIPEGVLASYPAGGLNVHLSRLPAHRGPDPIAWTLLAGDDQAGVSFHRMTGALDAGPVVRSVDVPVLVDDDRGTLLERCLGAAARELAGALEELGAQPDELPWPEPKVEEGTTKGEFEPRPRPAAHKPCLDGTTAEAWRVLRAFLPRPGLAVRVGRHRARLVGARPLPHDGFGATIGAGRVVAVAGRSVRVATGDGSLWWLLDRPLPSVAPGEGVVFDALWH